MATSNSNALSQPIPVLSIADDLPILRPGVWIRLTYRLPRSLRPFSAKIGKFLYTTRGVPVWLDNALIRCALDAAPIPSVAAEHIEERWLMSQVLQSLKPGDLFLDVGSHIGLYAIGAARRVGDTGRVIAFEPTPATIDKLTRNVGLNRLSHRIDIRQMALSDDERTVEFVTAGTSMTNSIFSGYKPGQIKQPVPEQRISVKTGRLDDYFDGSRDTVAKIDTEGHEIPVLRGAPRLMASPARIFLELHPWAWGGEAGDWNDLRSLCRASGREIRLLDGTRLDEPAHTRTELVRV